jgi:signal transduction histidine kinase
MSPHQKAQLAFASAVILLMLSGLAAYMTIVRLLESEKWVIHTHQVRAALGDVDSTWARAGRARQAYRATGSESRAEDFEAAEAEVPEKLQYLRELTKDNPRQQELVTRLGDAISESLDLARRANQLKKTSPQDESGQDELTRKGLPVASEITSIMQQMRDEEQRLLATRVKVSDMLFVLAVTILAATFVLAVVLFAINYRFLSAELRAREQAERTARDREESLRRLTVRLLRLQDEERRKFSRELHDSLGQYLVGVKMNLDMLASTRPTDELLTGAIHLLNQSIAETRTISHLLHPPLLDEAGFASAAQWYVQGFGQRSGVDVRLEIPDDMGRLPKPIELGLFRVLQESLTNIHRHSKSPEAEIEVKIFPGRVVLNVRDYGKGIPDELLEGFRTKGTKSGVGLAGMQERIRDIGGRLDIESSEAGTLITAVMPLSEVRSEDVSAAD